MEYIKNAIPKFILDFQKSDVYNMLIIFQYAEDALDILNKERIFMKKIVNKITRNKM